MPIFDQGKQKPSSQNNNVGNQFNSSGTQNNNTGSGTQNNAGRDNIGRDKIGKVGRDVQVNSGADQAGKASEVE